MRIDIMSSVNLNALNNFIENYENAMNSKASYLIMSQKTYRALVEESEKNNISYKPNVDSLEVFNTQYRGVPVAIHDNLSFGKVDVI